MKFNEVNEAVRLDDFVFGTSIEQLSLSATAKRLCLVHNCDLTYSVRGVTTKDVFRLSRFEDDD